MATLTMDKDNAILSIQKILKLVSGGKKLEIRIKEDSKIDIKKSYNKAIKDYNSWKVTERFIKTM